MSNKNSLLTEKPNVFCSTIVPTVGRSSLSRTVESVLDQNFSEEEFEIIVVNDSGQTLPDSSWQKARRVQIINTNKHERSIARNTGAAVSKGRYLHFLDDDDWLAPGAYRHLWELSQRTDAKWLYGITQLIDRETRPTILLKHHLQGNCFVQVMSGEWIPLQSSIIDRKTFIRVGGFNPLLTGPEDVDLLRRVLLEEDISETPHVISYVIRGEEGSTTDYSQHSLASRSARESIIDAPAAFYRMRLSANNPFWYGRMLRIYLTSAVWNLQHRQFFRAASRINYSLASILFAGKRALFKDYWISFSQPYASLTFENGIQEAKRVNQV